MNCVFVVLRNNKNAVCNVDFAPLVDAFTSFGFFADEVLLLPYEEIEKLHEKVKESVNSDLFCVICHSSIVQGVENNLSQYFSFSFNKDVAIDGNRLVCVLSADKIGVQYAKESVIPLLCERLSNRFDRMVIRSVGAPKEVVQCAIDEAYAVSGDAIVYNFTEDYLDQRLEMIYDAVTPKMIADGAFRAALSHLDEYVYALDDTTLEERVYDGLKLRGRRLSVAESFTGGRISARMVKVSGVSSVYHEGITAYANTAKEERLGVSNETLREFGAVSAQTAHEMVQGLLNSGNCNVCVATTGIAGPKSDDTKKPVGLCYIAAGIDDEIFVNEYVLNGDRETITQTAVNLALFAVFKLVKN